MGFVSESSRLPPTAAPGCGVLRLLTGDCFTTFRYANAVIGSYVQYWALATL